jgi:predicted regulator of Ras-like GTPase activity (Roadblock/LC7/MglB family)
LTLPLSAIIAKWPEGVRSAIATIDANQTSLILPMAETEAAMRKGKVQFAWKQIRSYLTPAVSPTLLAEADEVMLELPLAVLAPLFMAAKKPSAQKKVAVGENIPDLFKPKPPEPVAVAEPTPAPVEATPAPAEPVAVANKPLTPAEVIQQAVGMADVAGALITTTDGLLVDTQLPTGMDAAKIAAFVPQAYLRLAELAKAMGGAESNVVTFQLDHAPVALFKHANIYCAVVGKRGLPLPLLHLAALLNELAAQPK